MRLPTRGTLVLCVGLVAVAVSTRWVRLNISPSVPLGLYVLRPVRARVHRGDLVVVPVPLSVQHVWSRWIPLLKPVAAVAGDVVCSSDTTLSVHDADYGPIFQDANGMPLPHIAIGCQVIPEGALFLASPIVRSVDSRYYGAVRATDIAAVAFPIAIWR